VGAYFTLLVGGAGVALLILRASTRLKVVEGACLAWLFGVAVVSLLLWLGGTLISGFALQSLVSLFCLALGMFGWRVTKRREVQFSVPRPNNRLEWILTAALLLELLIIFVVCLKHTLGWDGLLNWELKARYAFLSSGILPQSYYSSPGRAFSHPEYPLAIPFTELWLYLWMGEPHQFWVKTMFPLFYIAGALLVALLIARLTGKRWLGLLIALLLPFVPFVTASPGGVIVGYADIPLGVFYATALGYLLCSLDRNLSYSFPIYVATLTLIPWIKSEGVILWSLLALMGLAAGWYQYRIRPAILSILPGLFLIIGWRVYLHVMHAAIPSDFARPTLQLLSVNLNRLGAIIGTAFAEITEISHWSIFWLLAVIAIIYLLVARTLSRLLLAIGVLGPVILYLLTYLFSAWPSYTAHITSSLPRLLLHVMPAAWLAIGLALSPPKAKTET
ncbi:MAG: hypothetical protein QOF93_389, partial [Verrucomicrobiota bacterium]